MGIPIEQPRSQNYVERKCWTYEVTSDKRQMLLDCPLCGKEKHFYMALGGERDGLWDCKVCGRTGNLPQLQTELGDRTSGLYSMQDNAASHTTPAPLPNVDKLHEALLLDGDALEYLVGERGLNMATIQKQKLGLELRDSYRWVVIPYFHKDDLIYVKSRTIPPAPREFHNTAGREAPLYNDVSIASGAESLILTEGEFDALTLLSAGFENVCGVPGANMKKAAWITKLDKASLKKIYLVYDSDKVGQTAARDMATRIGLDKVFNVNLPTFTTKDGKDGKDINEWFVAGHTREDFLGLLEQAEPFDVLGVTSVQAALDDLEREIDSPQGLKPLFDSPWPSLNARLGGADRGEVVGIMAEAKLGKTSLALNWEDYLTYKGYSCLMLCLEMKVTKMVRKLVSLITETEDNLVVGGGGITKATVAAARENIKDRPGDLLFGYIQNPTMANVFDLVRQAKKRYGIDVLCFDNLQFLVRSIEHSAQETSIISKRFKDLAMELNILILLIVQPNRVKEGNIVSSRNAAGSAAIEKDVDSMIILHRKRIAEIKADEWMGFIDTDENFEPLMYVRVDLNRYGSGGACALYFDGKFSKVRELSEVDLQGMRQAPLVSGGAIPTEQTPSSTTV